ncbi:hypothetical protein ACFSR7_05865 [Cohnella sp. GCM10020058]|uniref:hypothetical protein n=1 Tax=Cohnella sp. GCM10020058 TaxID=3317330 RepID=UPI0036389BAB
MQIRMQRPDRQCLQLQLFLERRAGRDVAGAWLTIAADPNDTAARRRLQQPLLLERRAGRDVAGAWLTIAADPDATADRRCLQLQQLLERSTGRDIASSWLPIAADPDDTAGRWRLQLQLLRRLLVSDRCSRSGFTAARRRPLLQMLLVYHASRDVAHSCWSIAADPCAQIKKPAN